MLLDKKENFLKIISNLREDIRGIREYVRLRFINEDLAQKFKLIGVKDSKMLSIKRIYLLEREIIKSSNNFKVIKLSAETSIWFLSA